MCTNKYFISYLNTFFYVYSNKAIECGGCRNNNQPDEL